MKIKYVVHIPSADRYVRRHLDSWRGNRKKCNATKFRSEQEARDFMLSSNKLALSWTIQPENERSNQ